MNVARRRANCQTGRSNWRARWIWSEAAGTWNSLKPGDAVTVQGILARDGSLQVWGNSIVLTSTGRQVLAMSPEAIAGVEAGREQSGRRPTPRWPDGKPRLGAAPGETGYWAQAELHRR